MDLGDNKRRQKDKKWVNKRWYYRKRTHRRTNYNNYYYNSENNNDIIILSNKPIIILITIILFAIICFVIGIKLSLIPFVILVTLLASLLFISHKERTKLMHKLFRNSFCSHIYNIIFNNNATNNIENRNNSYIDEIELPLL